MMPGTMELIIIIAMLAVFLAVLAAVVKVLRR